MPHSHHHHERSAAGPGHDHGHDHDHHHHHGAGDSNRAFAVGVTLNVAFVAAEAFWGVGAHSLALLADAGHNLGDVLGLLLAWAASWAGRRQPSRRWTYGLGRGTILASLVNAVILLLAVGGIGWEAILRFAAPQPVAGVTVMAVAAAGIVVNAGTAAMFMAGRHADLNIRSAFVHMAADAAVSLGVVVAALVMTRTGWLWLDPAVSLTIVVVVAAGTWDLLREALDLALDAVPAGIDLGAVEAFLAQAPGVAAVHDLHVWPLSTTSVALTAHLVKPQATVDDGELYALAGALHDRFGIDHATIQVERGDGDECRLAPRHVV